MRCEVCGEPGSKACTRCGTCYCSSECQKKGWFEHKSVCKERATLRALVFKGVWRCCVCLTSDMEDHACKMIFECNHAVCTGCYASFTADDAERTVFGLSLTSKPCPMCRQPTSRISGSCDQLALIPKSGVVQCNRQNAYASTVKESFLAFLPAAAITSDALKIDVSNTEKARAYLFSRHPSSVDAEELKHAIENLEAESLEQPGCDAVADALAGTQKKLDAIIESGAEDRAMWNKLNATQSLFEWHEHVRRILEGLPPSVIIRETVSWFTAWSQVMYERAAILVDGTLFIAPITMTLSQCSHHFARPMPLMHVNGKAFDCIAEAEESRQEGRAVATIGKTLREHENRTPLVMTADKNAMARLTIAPFVDSRHFLDWIHDECGSVEVDVFGYIFNDTKANFRLAATSVVAQLLQHLTSTADITRSTQRIFNGLIRILEELTGMAVPMETSCSCEDLVEGIKRAGKLSASKAHIGFVRQLVAVAHDALERHGAAAMVTFDVTCTDGGLCVPMRYLI